MLATLISGDRERPGVELESRARRVAGGLTALGLVPGDVVAVLMRNDFPVVELALGAEMSGIVGVPLNWHAGADDIGYVLRDCDARLLVAHTDLLRKVKAIVPPSCRIVEVEPPPEVRTAYRLADADCAFDVSTRYEEWLAASPRREADPVAPPYRLLYTSGTTGRPKGVRRSNADPAIGLRLAKRVRSAHGLDERPIRALLTGPLYHSAPNVYAQNCTRVGQLLVLQPKFEAEDLLRLVDRHRLTHLHAVPTMFSRLLDLGDDVKGRYDVSSLVAVVHGAAVCPPDVKRAMIAWWGPVLLEYYAATEVGIITASTSAEWLAHPGTVGRPPDGVEIVVVDEGQRPVEAGCSGEIFIRSEAAALVDYHHRPEALEELRRGEWITLGDVGHIDADGFLWITDRKKDMVITGGVNVFPAELEAVGLRMPGVRDCVAFGVADRELGEALALAIEAHDGVVIDADAVRSVFVAELGRLRSPKVVVTVTRLPREDSGKIARRKVRQSYLDSLGDA